MANVVVQGLMAKAQTLVASVNELLTTYDAKSAKAVEQIATVATVGLPQSATLKGTRTYFQEVASIIRDARHGFDNGLLVKQDLRRDLKAALRVLSSELIPQLGQLPDELSTAKSSGKTMAESTVLSEASDIDEKQIASYAKRAKQIPTSVPHKSGILMLSKIPIVVIGLFGPKLDKVRTLTKVASYVDGYAVLDNQMIIGIDQKKRPDLDIEQVMEAYNIRSATDVSLVAAETATPFHRHGSVNYWWVMPTRTLNNILRIVGSSFFEDWGFPNKVVTISKKSSKKLDEAALETIFRMLGQDKPIEKIAEKVGVKPHVVAAIISGQQMAAETFSLRNRYVDKIRKAHKQLLEVKRRYDQEQNVKIPVGAFKPPSWTASVSYE